jgi:hypothetical protein
MWASEGQSNFSIIYIKINCTHRLRKSVSARGKPIGILLENEQLERSEAGALISTVVFGIVKENPESTSKPDCFWGL